ncbi:hypothetical protein GGI12_005333 [Dipsacomyces acuminosporus]|nr:hypothetical protein GGI12_005333 [Dipsacomyces acuminosporus]
MSAPTIAPHGSWKSPISAKAVASASSSMNSLLVDRANPSRVYWLESRPSEGGRRALLSKDVDDCTEDSLVEHTPDKKWNVRTSVHEYGGGAYAVYDGLVVFANWSDQGVYLLDTKNGDASAVPQRIGTQNDKLRYAAFAIHPSKKFVVAVREDHRESDLEAPAALVAIALPKDTAAQDGYAPAEDAVLFDSSDFVSSPVFSPINDEIAFYAWNHPDMNWDATTLYRATLVFDADGIPSSLSNQTTVAGGEDDPRESVYQPRFDQDGRLHFLSDRSSGFWNPYHAADDGAATLSLSKPIPAEFGEPEWGFAASTFQPIPGRKSSFVDFKAPEGELPPLLTLSHGGPTGATHAIYNLSIQYWTSRGFAVIDVNYGGSTGYGREYRERLYPHFGEVDVQDCCAAALYLADAGLVDRRRLTIMGGSAGGFTTLACLAFRPEVFAVGASLYGISDLEILAKESHKFELRYPVHLVGPYPEERDTYLKRSPIYSVDNLSCPAIFLQGLEDKVVPPNQATMMVDALKEKGIPVAHIEFEGEQHGFRQAKNIIRALEAQFYFFGRILGFAPADDIDPVSIFNDSA